MIGDNIKRLMKANGYNQKELAIRSGCTETSISKYVNNEREPSIKALKNLAIALGVTVDELLGNATLDVVPREEVDRLRQILNSYAIQYGSVKDQQEVIDRIKADTVRKLGERLKDRYEFECNADEDNALYYLDLCEWVERIEKELLGETHERT